MKLLRIFLIMTLLIVSLMTMANSQSISRWGILGGLNLGKIASEDNTTTSPLVGYSFGGILEIGVNDQVSIQPEIHYVLKGSEAIYGYNTDFTSQRTIMRYIDIPILVKVNFSGTNFTPHLLFGPDFGIKITSVGTVRYFNYPESQYAIIERDGKSLNVALDFGGGIDIGISSKINYMIDFRYSIGMTSIIEEKPHLTPKTRDFQIMSGLLFNL